MAGKSKMHGAGPVVAPPPTGISGHLGLKSSPYCVTDAKLTSQLIVRDRMNAHYKNLAHAKSAIDTKTPKSMLISTKKRDQARREAWAIAVQSGVTPRSLNKRAAQSRAASRATSDLDRQDLLNAYASLSDDYSTYQRNGTGSLEVQPPSDLTQEYSKLNDTYPRPTSARLGKSFRTTLNNTRPGSSPRTTPRSGDILESRKHVFTDTDNKQFQPRILKTNHTSRLSQLKLYNPPVKKTSARSPSPDGKQMSMRSEAALTNQTLTSTELMNESLVSRDHNQARTPTGIPPLDISLDKDHLKWIHEQSLKTPNRSARSHRPDLLATQNLGRLNSTIGNNQMKTLSTGEEELKYLDFIRDVTNDVLDRGIFTDRVLKKVFNSHIEKRKHELDVARMQEMVADLREDLNIPENDDEAEETSGEKTRAYLGKQRPPVPKARTHYQTLRSVESHNTKTNKDINENIVNDFDTLKSMNGYDDKNTTGDSYTKTYNVDKPMTLDDLAEPTERSMGLEEDTFRNIAPAVSNAVRSATTFGEGSGPSTPKEETFSRQPSLASAKENSISRQASFDSTKDLSISQQASQTSLRENSMSRQPSLASAKENSISRQASNASTRENSISRQASVASVKENSISRQASVASVRENGISRQASITSAKENGISRQASDASAKEDSISRQTSVNSVREKGLSRQASLSSTKSENQHEKTENGLDTGRSKNSASPENSDDGDNDITKDKSDDEGNGDDDF